MSWKRLARKGQAPKFGNEKVSLDGFKFGSKLEAAVYQELKLRKLGGEIDDIRCQVQVYLSEARVIYRPDFSFTHTLSGETHYAEAKGFEAPRWPTIKKLWKFYGPGKLEIYKGTHRSPVLVETLIPRARKNGDENE